MNRRVIEWEDWAGTVEAVLEAVPDQRIVMCRDTARIAREARRRGLWPRLKAAATAKKQIILGDDGHKGIDLFAWMDEPAPGGYLWVSLPGARKDSQAFAIVRDWLFAILGWVNVPEPSRN